jgi:hypothetical protein
MTFERMAVWLKETKNGINAPFLECFHLGLSNYNSKIYFGTLSCK